jgi:hypothetical protein
MAAKTTPNTNKTNAQITEAEALTQEECEDAILSAIGDARDISGAPRIQHSDAWK